MLTKLILNQVDPWLTFTFNQVNCHNEIKISLKLILSKNSFSNISLHHQIKRIWKMKIITITMSHHFISKMRINPIFKVHRTTTTSQERLNWSNDLLVYKLSFFSLTDRFIDVNFMSTSRERISDCLRMMSAFAILFNIKDTICFITCELLGNWKLGN